MEWLPMVGVGIAWASILSIPYAMLSGSLPSDKMGYMGVFNFFINPPKVAASILGFSFQILIMNLFMHFDWSINDSSWNYRTYHMTKQKLQ
jgi:hypothetical protein